jgi:hypothetical protein
MKDENEAQRKAFMRELSNTLTEEDRLKKAIESLGEKWVAHPANAPKRGNYNPLTGAKL